MKNKWIGRSLLILPIVLTAIIVSAFILRDKEVNKIAETRKEETQALTYGDWEYTVSGNEATIIRYNATASSVSIPSNINGYTVTGIKSNSIFADTLTIPETITYIEGDVGPHIKTINYNAINASTSADGSNSYDPLFGYKVEAVNIGNKVESLPKCLAMESKITSISIPNSVKKIDSGAFMNCELLTGITIPNSVTQLGDSAFDGCTSLTNATIKSKEIGFSAFTRCYSLETFTLSNNVEKICAYAFYKCTALSNVTIPSSVTVIGDQAFCGCASLTDITIQSIVAEIKNSFVEDDTTIHCYRNSTAQIFAAYDRHNYVLINPLSRIEAIKQPYKSTYVEEEKFNPYDMQIKAYYSDGTNEVITSFYYKEDYSNWSGLLDGYELGFTFEEDGNSLSVGQTSVTISYTEGGVKKTTSQAITVTKKSLSSIYIITQPNKTSYIEGENFNFAGMVVRKYYDNNKSEEIDNYIIENGSNLTAGQTSVTISYTENGVTRTADQPITVIARVLTGISVKTNPNKVQYIKDFALLDLAGGKILLSYSDNTTEERDMTASGVNVSGYNNSTLGEQQVTVSYEGFSTTFNIEVRLLGDVNKDNIVDITDIMQLKRHILAVMLGETEGEWILPKSARYYGDMDSSNELDITDVYQLKTKVLDEF